MLYEGEFRDDEYHGLGSAFYENGSYFGEFKLGKRDGEGTYYFNDGRSYAGEWKNDLEHGRGKHVFLNGEYVGEFQYGKRHGKGTYTFKDGRKYVGTWADDKRNGHGDFRFADGEIFKGEWRNDMRHGEGKMYKKSGKLLHRGRWLGDELVDHKKLLKKQERYTNSGCDPRFALSADEGIELHRFELLQFTVLNEISDPESLPEVGRTVMTGVGRGIIRGRSTEYQTYRVELEKGGNWHGPLKLMTFEK